MGSMGYMVYGHYVHRVCDGSGIGGDGPADVAADPGVLPAGATWDTRTYDRRDVRGGAGGERGLRWRDTTGSVGSMARLFQSAAA
jgi:hypothetical protein